MSDEFSSPTESVTLADFWPTPEAVARCVPVDGESVADASFLAVHQPIRLIRRSLADPSAPPSPADEQSVLTELLKPDLPGGFVVVPIVGPHGAGKSHLLRWLRLHIPSDRHIVHIPKGTDPAQISERLRAELKFTEEAPETITEESLVMRLREALKQRTAEARAECDASMKRDGKVDPALRAIAETHGPGLVALLEGPTKDSLPHGTSEFTAADFEFQTVQTHKLTDPKLQRYVQKLKTNMQNERATAATLLNEVRAGILAQASELSESPLTKASRRVREELHKEAKELVLLIDDFDTLAEAESDLRDVIATESVREGKANLCPLRTALTVTNVEELPGEEFAFAQHFAEDEVLEAITDMIGAYLNAARSHTSAELSDADRETLAAFGTTRQGHSLFPFTRAAIHQLAREHLTVDGQLRFNPGKVIEDLLLRPLRQPETLPEDIVLGVAAPAPAAVEPEPEPAPVPVEPEPETVAATEPEPAAAPEERDPLVELVEQRRELAATSPSELLVPPDVTVLWKDLLAMVDAAVTYRREPAVADTLKAEMRKALEDYRDAISASWIGWIHANMPPHDDTDLAPPEPQNDEGQPAESPPDSSGGT